MAPRDVPLDDATDEECTTTTSFGDHAIEDGTVLIQRTYYRLAAAETTFEPTDEFFEALESAFIWAYLGSNDERGVPDHVAAAVDDALARTRAEFEDRPNADLRTTVLPAFYQHLAGFHCAYRST